MIIRALKHSKLLAFACVVLVLFLLTACGEPGQEPQEGELNQTFEMIAEFVIPALPQSMQ